MIKVFFTSSFVRSFKKLPHDIQLLAGEKIELVRNNPFDQRLNTHKLEQKLKKCWSFSVNYKYRVIFTFEGDKIIFLQQIGNHDIYTKFFQ